MKTNVNFKTFDVVKLSASSDIMTKHPNAKDFYGIVREIGTTFSFVEWYNRKNANATAEAMTDCTWVPNTDIESVGSLYHLIAAGLAPATPVVAKAAEVAKPKRKYTRKEGSAKPGPKPKKENITKEKKVKAPKATKTSKVVTELAKKIDEEIANASDEPKIVPWPTRRGNPISCFNFTSNNYGMATGKFKYFQKREDIKKSINTGCNYYDKIDMCLDFIVIGEKPGPAKIAKLNRFYSGVIQLTEEQWLALLGSPKFKFEQQYESRISNRPKITA